MIEDNLIIQGDPISAIIQILTDAPEMAVFNLAAITDNESLYATGMPFVVLYEAGGTDNWPVSSRPRIDINVYHPQRPQATAIMSTAIGCLQRVQSSYRGNGLRLCGVTLETAPFLSSRRSTDDYRVICSLRLTIRPLE